MYVKNKNMERKNLYSKMLCENNMQVGEGRCCLGTTKMMLGWEGMLLNMFLPPQPVSSTWEAVPPPSSNMLVRLGAPSKFCAWVDHSRPLLTGNCLKMLYINYAAQIFPFYFRFITPTK